MRRVDVDSVGVGAPVGVRNVQELDIKVAASINRYIRLNTVLDVHILQRHSTAAVET